MHKERKDAEKLPFTALSEDFDPHVPVSTLRSKSSCRLVSDSFLAFSKFSGSYQKLITYALRILSKKRYTHAEMLNKLNTFSRKRGLADAEIEPVIQRLFELNYLDDKKYAEDFILSKLRIKPAGKFFLKGKLRLKGINAEIIDSALDNAGLDESNLAIEALGARKRMLGKYPLQKQREKAFRFLASRGFVSDAIYKAIEKCYDLPR
jgi:regulatory protein